MLIGHRHVLAMNNYGEVFSWGDGRDGKLGIGILNPIITASNTENNNNSNNNEQNAATNNKSNFNFIVNQPVIIPFFTSPNTFITYISAGYSHSVAIAGTVF